MRLETNIGRIAELTRQSEDDDRQYRRLLGEGRLAAGEIDAIVRRHYSAVVRQIECRECANCCKVFRPVLKAGDVDRLAAGLGISQEVFVQEYLAEYNEGKGYLFNRRPCPFLVKNACTVYPFRPDQCRSYPNFNRQGFVLRLEAVLSDCSICPIAYNVYGRVKREIRERQVSDSSSKASRAKPDAATGPER